LLQSSEHGSETWKCTKEDMFFCGQKVYQVDKFISAYALSMGKVLSRRVMYEWIEMFRNGRMSVTGAECSGHPTTATTAHESLKQKSNGQNNSKTTEYQHWGCLFCGA
jgi:hypothetical protein